MSAYIYGRIPNVNGILLLRHLLLPDNKPETIKELKKIIFEYLGATDIRIVIV